MASFACARLPGDGSDGSGPYSGRSTDIGVVLDLMVHDLDLILDLVRSPVETVEAVGHAVYGRHEDVAAARLVFADGCEARLGVSRASPDPCRQMRLWAAEGFARIDFAARSLTLVQPPGPSPAGVYGTPGPFAASLHGVAEGPAPVHGRPRSKSTKLTRCCSRPSSRAFAVTCIRSARIISWPL